VQDGDRVKAGDILVQLDDTVTRANLAIVTKGLDELAARKARLEAGATARIHHLSARAVARARTIHRSHLRSARGASVSLRRTARSGQKAQLQQRIASLKDEIIV